MRWLHISLVRSSSPDEHDNNHDGQVLIVRIGKLLLSFAVEWRA